MFNYDFPRDQDLCQLRIGLDTSIIDVSRHFFIPGKAQLGLPRVTVGSFCAALATPAWFTAGDVVPLIYTRRGIVHFGKAKWGTSNRSGDLAVTLKKAERRSLGFPAIIPASFIDMMGTDDAGVSRVVRLRSRKRHCHLFIGCTYSNNRLADAETVTPLICEAGEDVAPFLDWQPFLIAVKPYPTQENFAFLHRKDNGNLQAPLPQGSLDVEGVSMVEAHTRAVS